MRLLALLSLLVAGCASAGGTAGIFDLGSVWYKHPTTADVKECGGGFYPGVQIRRQACGKALIGVGYTEMVNEPTAPGAGSTKGDPCHGSRDAPSATSG